MLLDVLTYPDPRLKHKAAPIGEIVEAHKELAENMAETMYASRGVGLAAPQVGVSLRMIIIDPSGPGEKSDLRVLLNPAIECMGEQVKSEKEGCLSVPLNYRADVKRYEQVRVKALRLDGSSLEEIWDGYPAIILQHEMDHLEGILFIDHISRLRRTLFESKVKKWQKRESLGA